MTTQGEAQSKSAGGPAGGVQAGFVAAFDVEVGLGTAEAEDGRTWPFHCTQITDGSRSIAVGTPITFLVAAGHRGTWEAASVRPGT